MRTPKTKPPLLKRLRKSLIQKDQIPLHHPPPYILQPKSERNFSSQMNHANPMTKNPKPTVMQAMMSWVRLQAHQVAPLAVRKIRGKAMIARMRIGNSFIGDGLLIYICRCGVNMV